MQDKSVLDIRAEQKDFGIDIAINQNFSSFSNQNIKTC